MIRPEGHRPSLSSRGSEHAEYQYADRGSRYAPDGRKLSYTATSQAQFIDAKPQYHDPPSLHRLSVSGGAAGAMLGVAAAGQHAPMHGALPPGSPLLEAYHGTYQSISPMPSPMMLPSHMDDGLSDLEPLDGDSDDSRGHKQVSILKKKSVKTVSCRGFEAFYA